MSWSLSFTISETTTQNRPSGDSSHQGLQCPQAQIRRWQGRRLYPTPARTLFGRNQCRWRPQPEQNQRRCGFALGANARGKNRRGLYGGHHTLSANRRAACNPGANCKPGLQVWRYRDCGPLPPAYIFGVEGPVKSVSAASAASVRCNLCRASSPSRNFHNHSRKCRPNHPEMRHPERVPKGTKKARRGQAPKPLPSLAQIV